MDYRTRQDEQVARQAREQIAYNQAKQKERDNGPAPSDPTTADDPDEWAVARADVDDSDW